MKHSHSLTESERHWLLRCISCHGFYKFSCVVSCEGYQALVMTTYLLWYLFIKSLNGCFIPSSDGDPYITEATNNKFFIGLSLFLLTLIWTSFLIY